MPMENMFRSSSSLYCTTLLFLKSISSRLISKLVFSLHALKSASAYRLVPVEPISPTTMPTWKEIISIEFDVSWSTLGQMFQRAIFLMLVNIAYYLQFLKMYPDVEGLFEFSPFGESSWAFPR